jgi:hypothetical protein
VDERHFSLVERPLELERIVRHDCHLRLPLADLLLDALEVTPERRQLEAFGIAG